jgi:hypothetical protein
MARRTLPSTSARIFSKKPSFTTRLIGAGLLTLSLLVVLVGVGSAVYLERVHGSPDASSPPQLAEAPAPTPALPAPPSPPASHDPMSAAAAMPPAASPEPLSPAVAAVETAPPAAAPSPETATALAAVEPQAGRPPKPARDADQTARLEAAPPEPAAPENAEETPAIATAEPPAYWVEYAVYAGKSHAQRLQRKLAEKGLETVIVPTRTPAGRPLLRVRSARIDHATALAAAETAQAALKIRPLVHRDRHVAPDSRAIAVASAAPQGYWVQYGAFAHRQNAQRLGAELARHGVDARVYLTRGTGGKPLYLLRSSGLPDHASAAALAKRYEQVATAGVLIGHSPAIHGKRHAPVEAPLPARRQTG